MPERRPGHGRAGVADAGEVEGGLQGAVLAGAAVAADERGVEIERSCAARAVRPDSANPPLGAATNCSVAAPRGTPSTNASASSPGSTSNHSPVFDQKRARDRADRRVRSAVAAPGGLQAGEHAHVVLGGGTSEDDGDVGHGGGGSSDRTGEHERRDSERPGSDGSRVVVRQIVLVQHRVARSEVATNPLDRLVLALARARGPTGARYLPKRPRRAGPGGWCAPRSPGRRRPRRPRSPNLRFSSYWRVPSSTMPGSPRRPDDPPSGPVAATRWRRGPRGRPSPGRVGVVGVVEDRDAGGGARAPAGGGRPRAARRASPRVSPNRRRARVPPPTAQARLVGCTPGGDCDLLDDVRALHEHGDREPPVASRTTQTSADAVDGRAPHDPLARSPARPVGQRGQTRVVDREHDVMGASSRISALASTIRVLGPEALEVDRTDGGDDRDVGRAPSTELGDLTRAVGAHLGDEHLGAVGKVLVDRAGQPGPVVEAGRGGHHRP